MMYSPYFSVSNVAFGIVLRVLIWLVVLTILKNSSQWEDYPIYINL